MHGVSVVGAEHEACSLDCTSLVVIPSLCAADAVHPKKRYGGKGVLKAVANVNDVIAPELLGMSALEQRA
ncbi:MAG: hypothetical protein IKX15_00840, partial [Spirochaetales bacterium]|nr:hypothetical protein [Spirochaetales bacterium]